MSVWPDLADASAPPLQARVAGTVCAVAVAPSPDSGAFAAAFATTDGALHIMQVTPGRRRVKAADIPCLPPSIRVHMLSKHAAPPPVRSS